MAIRFDPSNRVHQIYRAAYGLGRPFSMDFYRVWFILDA